MLLTCYTRMTLNFIYTEKPNKAKVDMLILDFFLFYGLKVMYFIDFSRTQPKLENTILINLISW